MESTFASTSRGASIQPDQQMYIMQDATNLEKKRGLPKIVRHGKNGNTTMTSQDKTTKNNDTSSVNKKNAKSTTHATRPKTPPQELETLTSRLLASQQSGMDMSNDKDKR
jgi:hypothetical protein